jgi:hypothetical protein
LKNLECYYDLTKDESLTQSNKKASVLEMLGNPYSPAWLPEAIINAARYSNFSGNYGIGIFALCAQMERQYFTNMHTFIGNLIKEINGTYEAQGAALSSVNFCEILGRELSSSDLRTMQKRLQKARACEFDRKAA